MVALKVELFGGMAPAVDRKYLPVNNAGLAVNAWLDTGVLTGFYKLHEIVTAPMPRVGKAFRIPQDYDAPYVIDKSDWLFFENPDTDVVRGATFGDTYDRYYWASSSAPPQYNTRQRIADDDPPWLLGIPTPLTAPTVDPTLGVSTTLVTRAYVVTYVSEYGEEGAPSPAGIETGRIDDTWTITTIPVPDPLDQGTNRNITAKRLYRTITGSTGIATFFLVTELAPSVTSFVDTIADTDITGGTQLQSSAWTPPPDDLEGFCMGPNGILAGWRGNEIWFAEPYRLHAWPAAYVRVVEFPIVGLASIGNSFFIMTRGYPVVMSGTIPLNLAPLRMPLFEPCTSRGGIVVFPEGVYYPSGNGLILLSSGGVVNATKTFITKERWQSYVQNANFRAGRIGSAYYGYGTIQFGVFQPDTFQNDAFAMEDSAGAHNGIYIDATIPRISLILLHSDIPVSNVQNDAWSSELLVLKENKVYWLNLMNSNQITEPAEWWSKQFQVPYKLTFGAAMIFFDLPPLTITPNPVRDTAQDQVLKPDQYGIIRWYGDDRLLAVHEIRKSGEMLRLPSDAKYDNFEFQVETRVNISAIHFASNPKELRTLV